MEDCDKTISRDGKTTVYTCNGRIVAKCCKTDNVEYWYNADGKLHHDDGPAMIFYDNGQITSESWYCDGRLHRDDRPAEIYYDDGQKVIECWYRDDKLDGGVLAYVWLADMVYHLEIYVPGRKNYTLDGFRDAVKGPLALELMRPLPIPIREAIFEHYCLQ